MLVAWSWPGATRSWVGSLPGGYHATHNARTRIELGLADQRQQPPLRRYRQFGSQTSVDAITAIP